MRDPQRPYRGAALSGRRIGGRPRVLFLSCHLPWPALSGGRRRELELIKRIAGRFDVHLLVVSKTPAEDRANRARLERYCRKVEVFATDPAPEPDAREPGQVLRHRSEAATARVGRIVAEGTVDLIHVEGFYLMQHVPQRPAVPVVLVEQNVEYELEQQWATCAAERDQARITRSAERRCWRRATRLAAVTAEDRRTIRGALPGAEVAIVPDGADHLPHLRVVGPGEHAITRPSAPLLVLVANFAYAPNVDAAAYLCRQILPRVRRQLPDVALWLVGNAPPPEVRRLAGETVTVTGRVPDVLPYLDAADLVVCPLRIGGGIKVKMIEALCRGKAIISTSIGAQGLPLPARAAIAIRDDPGSFAEAVSLLWRAPQRRAQLARRAARAARGLPSWDDAARALSDVYDELLGERPARDRQPAWTAAL